MNAKSSADANSPRSEISTLKKFIIGGIGGLAPLLATLYFADASLVTNYVQALDTDPEASEKLVGFLTRVPILFLFGGFWAYLHHSEQDPLKVFQLGIVAPAMIVGMVSAANVQEARANEQTDAWLSIISEAYAQTMEPETPPVSGWESYLKGLLGRP